MKPYWNETHTWMPGFGVKELKLENGNIYVMGEYERVWQIWFEEEGPMFRLIDRA